MMTDLSIRKPRPLLRVVAISAAISGAAALAGLAAAQDADDELTEPGAYGEEAVLPEAVAGARLRSANKTCKLDLGPAQLDVTVDGHTHEPFDPRVPGDAIAELRDSRQRLWMTLLRDLKPEVQIRAVCSTSPDVRDDETFTSQFMPIFNSPRATFACPDANPYLISMACRTRRLDPALHDAGTPLEEEEN